MTGGANAALFAGEGKQVFVVAVLAANRHETLGEVATAQELLKNLFKIFAQRTQVALVFLRVIAEEVFSGCLQTLVERRCLGLAGTIGLAHKA